VQDEFALMGEDGIDTLVTKNSGGSATYAKIVAARQLGLPVILLKRPVMAEAETVTTANEAMLWIEGGQKIRFQH
jgi:precorrin-6A/cobalt-precorrin-6A reductase